MLHSKVHTDTGCVGCRWAHSHWALLGHLPADHPVGCVLLWLWLDPSCSLWPCKIPGAGLPMPEAQEMCAVCLSHVRELCLPQADVDGVTASSAQPDVLQLFLPSFLPSPRSVTENPGNILSKQFLRLESQYYFFQCWGTWQNSSPIVYINYKALNYLYILAIIKVSVHWLQMT